MKTKKIFKLMTMFAVIGIIVTLAYCKKDEVTPDPITITVHDTVKVDKIITLHDTTKVYVHDTTYINANGKAVSGLATYKDASGVTANAKGAVVTLYSGSAVDATKIVAYTYADASGIYKFPTLTAGNYFITAKYNTDNKNYKMINGVNFATNPGYAVTMAAADLTQNISLETIATVGTIRVDADTNRVKADPTLKLITETHSKVVWNSGYQNGQAQTLQGAFNVLKFDRFSFDEANPANTVINGYVLLSSITTFEPARDALYWAPDKRAGCVPKTLNVDTITKNGVLMAVPETDTARFYSVSVEKYGDGYLVHGMLNAFYKHPTGGIYPADTAGGYKGPFNTTITKPVNMFFTFSKNKVVKSATQFNWYFAFEGEFTFKAKTDYYISSGNIEDAVNVKIHVGMMGDKNKEY